MLGSSAGGRDEISGQGRIGSEVKVDVAHQRPAHEEALGGVAAAWPLGDGVEACDRRRDVAKPRAVKLVPARSRARGPERPGPGERHLTIADHKSAPLHPWSIARYTTWTATEPVARS